MNKNLTSLIVRSLIGLLAVMVLAFVVGIAVGYLSASGAIDQDQATVCVIGIIAAALMAGGMVVSVAWMRSIDEAAREAHKAAWFWGGCGGMLACGPLFVLASLPQAAAWTFPSWFGGRTDPAAYAATGAFAVLLVMILGYTIVWAWWWWRRR
ncbi:MAG: hypothetical protein ACI9YM_001627 [Brevundimonas sp.]|jgi:hypothetical protein|uniref:hypothetical protein n=1 Tax=Brevundimonas sp. TaxID=1871086 RepID=UPI0039E6AAF6